MTKTMLITGSTDGIGLQTAQQLYDLGHHILLHGRSTHKLQDAKSKLLNSNGAGKVDTYLADLSSLSDVLKLSSQIKENHQQLDVLINNAGIFSTESQLTQDGFEIRFAVNAIAPYLLTKQLLALIGKTGRIVNLSSAAQAPVDLNAITSKEKMTDNAAYAQSKLLLTLWTRQLGSALAGNGPVVVAVNPKSFLGSKMVKEAYGIAGGNLGEGADILVRAATSDEFSQAFGKYFDNDIGRFSDPHPEVLNKATADKVMQWLDKALSGYLTQE